VEGFRDRLAADFRRASVASRHARLFRHPLHLSRWLVSLVGFSFSSTRRRSSHRVGVFSHVLRRPGWFVSGVSAALGADIRTAHDYYARLGRFSITHMAASRCRGRSLCLRPLRPGGACQNQKTMTPNHALQRTRRERRGCNYCVPCAGSLSLGR